MATQIYYLLRSRQDGSYLAARPDTPSDQPGYLLVFNVDYEALTYLNAHAPDVADKFAVESLPPSRLQPILQRWGYQGIGVVQEPRQPRVEFYRHS